MIARTTSTRVVAAIRKSLQVELPLRVMFETKSLAALARAVDAKSGGGATESAATALEQLLAGPRTEVALARASVTQEYFWHMSRGDADPDAYAMESATLLRGTLDRAAFASTVETVINRQSVYRTRFVERAGALFQDVPADAPPFVLDAHDLGDVPEVRWAEVIDGAFAELRRGLDMAPGHHVKGRLLALAPDHHVLLLVIHHGTGDGRAIGTLLRELWNVYERRLADPTFTLPPPVQFLEYAAARDRFNQSAAGRRHEEQWRSYLRDAPPVQTPVDRGRHEQDVLRDAAPSGITPDLMHRPYFDVALPSPARDAATGLVREERASPFLVYLSGLAWLLHQHSGQDDICIQTTYDPRDEHASLADLHGAATTWKVVRIRLHGCQSLRDVVKHNLSSFFDATELGVMPNFYELAPHTLRRMIFNYVPPSRRPEPSDPPNLEIVPLPRGFPVWKRPWDLHLTMIDGDQRTRVVWTGNERLFRRETVEALLGEYFEILGKPDHASRRTGEPAFTRAQGSRRGRVGDDHRRELLAAIRSSTTQLDGRARARRGRRRPRPSRSGLETLRRRQQARGDHRAVGRRARRSTTMPSSSSTASK